MKRFLGLILALAIIASFPLSVLGLENTDNPLVHNNDTNSLETILNQFHYQSSLASTNSSRSASYSSNSSDSTLLDDLRIDTVETLQSAGYIAFDVNQNTYDYVEQTLNTDLSQICPDSTGTYIIVISGEETLDSVNPASSIGGSAGASFQYTYNGTSYTLRYLTVTANDNGSYYKSSYYDVLKSKTGDFIVRCLDTLISIALDQIEEKIPLGTIASILGLSVGNINIDKPMTAILHANSGWTRVYTQIMIPDTGEWFLGSSTEFVQCVTYMSGDYYNATTNTSTNIPENRVTKINKSTYYSNPDWKKQNAVLGYLRGSTIFDTTGKVEYEYGGDVVITHLVNFGI